jgi:two-component system, NtrC family, nitrogen regulation sensor histidine kinase NtrY
MKFHKSLRFRIFFAMLLLLIMTFVSLSVLTVMQYREEAKDYHRERLLRKEQNIKQHINYVLKNTSLLVNSASIPQIFESKIHEIKDIHNLEIHLYGLTGSLLKSSESSPFDQAIPRRLNDTLLDLLLNAPKKQIIHAFQEDGNGYQSSYSYLTDSTFKPIAILHLPYIEDDGFMTKELKENLFFMALLYGVMLLLAILIAYFLSRFITRSLQTVSQKITDTQLLERNQKIQVEKGVSTEIAQLIAAYNHMIDQLEISAAQLALGERQAAWREMAKQVAHEIKNPLTPMRLTVQSFERKFEPSDPEIKKKLAEYSATLIQQIDTMSEIASAFATYAQLPDQKNRAIDLVSTTKLALDIFDVSYIEFSSNVQELTMPFDKSQLIRLLTNLVKNSIQTLQHEQTEHPKIEVVLRANENTVDLSVSDNGPGIAAEIQSRVFEPKFTTKSKGMGLGLAMVKTIVASYKGSIVLESSATGTRFDMRFPKP